MGRMYGRCYLVPAADREGVLDNLDFREKGGYTRAVVNVIDSSDHSVIHRALLYTANAANPGFVGPAPLDEIASTLAFTVGPSGPNIDYARNLIAYMRGVPGYSQEEDSKGENLFELDALIDAHVHAGAPSL
jgi:cation transport regulator ChaC